MPSQSLLVSLASHIKLTCSCPVVRLEREKLIITLRRDVSNNLAFFSFFSEEDEIRIPKTKRKFSDDIEAPPPAYNTIANQRPTVTAFERLVDQSVSQKDWLG